VPETSCSSREARTGTNEVQVLIDDDVKENGPHPVKLESSLNPGERTRNFCFASGRLRRGRV
jgi:hypothetical protein